MSEVGRDVPFRHLLHQPVDRLGAEPLPRFLRRREEHEAETVPPPLLAQEGVDAEQELEDRAAAHRRGLLRIAGETERQRTAVERGEAVADPGRDLDTTARQVGVLDPGQLAQEAPARRDHQAVIRDLAGVGQQHAAAIAQALGRRRVVVHPHALEETLQRDHQVGRLPQPGRYPDRARVVDELRARRDDVDLHVRVGSTQLAYRGQRGET